MSRPTPVDLVFGPDYAVRFAALRQAIEAAGHDIRDRDAFVLVREVVELLQSMHPDDAETEAVTGFVAFLHASYLFWLDGQPVVEADRGTLEQLLSHAAPVAMPAAGASYYVQLPLQRVWGEPVTGQPPEPLDGWFAEPSREGMRVLAAFGLHPARPGLTVVEAAGLPPAGLSRADGSPLFAPRMEGGARAGLASLAGTEELLELAYRVHVRRRGSNEIAGREPPPSA